MTDTFRKFIKHLENDHRLSMAQIRKICGKISEATVRNYETRGPTAPVCKSIRQWVEA